LRKRCPELAWIPSMQGCGIFGSWEGYIKLKNQTNARITS